METTINEKQKRISYINSIKGLAIWLVLLGHLLEEGLVLKSVIYSFHMPLFFSVYGLTYRKPDSTKDFFYRLFKRFVSYMATYIIWASIYSSFSFKNLAFIVYGTTDSIKQAGSSGVLWYLPAYFCAVFIFEIIMFISAKTKKENLISGIIFAVICVIGFILSKLSLIKYGYPWGFDIGCVCSLFLWFGYIFKSYILPKINQKHILNIVICIIGFGLTFLSLLVKTDSGYIRYASADYGNPLLIMIAAFGGITAFIILVTYLDRIKPVSKVLFTMGSYSLVIMVLQRDLTNFVIYHLSISDNTIACILLSIPLIIVAFIGSYIISNIVPPLAGKYQVSDIISKFKFKRGN
ncbi:MAG: acyltransferase family protein [Eubacterium sp.]